MSRVNEILKYVAVEMSKSGNPRMTWTQREAALMDLARWGECRFEMVKGVSNLADEEDFVTKFRPLGKKGEVYRFPTKGGGECMHCALDWDTRKALRDRFQKWREENDKALDYFPHEARVEWYRINILQSFL